MKISRVLLGDTSLQVALCCSPHTLVELSSTTFRVQALPYGMWVHPNNPDETLDITEEVVDSIVSNFDGNALDMVPVPWTHTDHPAENTGKVLAAIKVDDGLDLILDTEASDKIDKDLVGGVSLAIDFSYLDKKTGQARGPTMQHCALVSNPYIKGMRKFRNLSDEELQGLGIKIEEGRIAAGDILATPVFLAESNKHKQGKPNVKGGHEMTKKEMLAALKADHDIDVAALEESHRKLSISDELFGTLKTLFGVKGVSELSEACKVGKEAVVELAEIRNAVKGKVELVEGQKLKDVIVKQVESAVVLADRVLNLECEGDVEVLLQDKRITPAERDNYMSLRKSNPDLFKKMTEGLKVSTDVTSLSDEKGVDTSSKLPSDGTTKLSEDDTATEIARYGEAAGKMVARPLKGILEKRRQKTMVPAGA